MLNMAFISILNEIFEKLNVNIMKGVNWSPIVTPIEVCSSTHTTAYRPARVSGKTLYYNQLLNGCESYTYLRHCLPLLIP